MAPRGVPYVIRTRYFAADFLRAGFLAAGFLAGAFFAAGALVAAEGFLGAGFAAGFLAAVVVFCAAGLAAAGFAADDDVFFAAVEADLAGAFFAGAFLAAGLAAGFAGVFFAGALFAATVFFTDAVVLAASFLIVEAALERSLDTALVVFAASSETTLATSLVVFNAGPATSSTLSLTVAAALPVALAVELKAFLSFSTKDTVDSLSIKGSGLRLKGYFSAVMSHSLAPAASAPMALTVARVLSRTPASKDALWQIPCGASEATEHHL